jgi:hypothetical protein
MHFEFMPKVPEEMIKMHAVFPDSFMVREEKK